MNKKQSGMRRNICQHFYIFFMKKRFLFFLWMFLFGQLNLSAQNQRFSAGLVAGLNFADLTGDDFNYFGLNTGAMAAINLSDHWQIGMELLFSQNGEYMLPDLYPRISFGKIRLNHIEVPLYANWKYFVDDVKLIKGIHINAGMAFQRIFSHYARDVNDTDVTDSIIYSKLFGFGFQYGTTLFFTDQLGFNFKVNIPLSFFKVNIPLAEELERTLSFRVVYLLE